MLFSQSAPGIDSLHTSQSLDSLYLQDARLINPSSDGIADLLPAPAESLSGTAGDDLLVADLDVSTGLYGRKGDDYLVGSNQFCLLVGGAGDDVLEGGTGSGQFFGGSGNDVLLGGKTGEFLFGGIGNDLISGGRGADFLDGDNGRDRCIGGAGRDQFLIETASGKDIIVDFVDGQDTLGSFIDFADLVIQSRGRHTEIQSDGQTLAVLLNVEASRITADDFATPIIALV